jgi:hypothetical protein
MVKAGQPTKYKEDVCDDVLEYLDIARDSYHDTTRKLQVQLPTIEGLSLHLGVALSTVYLWAKEYPEFSESLELIKSNQKERLLSKGLSNEYNSTIAKLILSSNHGMSEKSVVAVEQPISEQAKTLANNAINDYLRNTK